MASLFAPAASAYDNVKCHSDSYEVMLLVCDVLNIPQRSWVSCFYNTAPAQWQAECVQPVLNGELAFEAMQSWLAQLPACLVFDHPIAQWTEECQPPLPIFLLAWEYLACYSDSPPLALLDCAV